jgi:uncharacterized RDD family membrane protein YckC
MERAAVAQDMHRSARVWKRILAFLIDLYFGISATWSFLLLVIGEVPQTPASWAQASDAILSPLALTSFLFASVFILLYHVFCEYVVGQTPGMLIMGIRVQRSPAENASKRSAKTEAQPRGIGLGQAFVRNLFIIPVLPFTLLWLIEPLYYVFHGERLLEHWTKTETIE